MKQLSFILDNETEVLTFLKARYPLYHLSNVFFRDIQYGIQLLLERKEMAVGYTDAEKIARAFVDQLVKSIILTPIDAQSWVLNYPDFRKPPVKPAAPVRPAAPAARPVGTAPAAPRPAGGLPPLKSSPVAGATKIAGGLPPLKSSAPPAAATASEPLPAGGESQTPGEKATEVAPAPQTSIPSTAPKATPQQSSGKTVPPLGARSLPPIKSSTPAGSKK